LYQLLEKGVLKKALKKDLEKDLEKGPGKSL
jgi:hypothetical protein